MRYQERKGNQFCKNTFPSFYKLLYLLRIVYITVFNSEVSRFYTHYYCMDKRAICIFVSICHFRSLRYGTWEQRFRGPKLINTFNIVKHSKDKCNHIAKKKSVCNFDLSQGSEESFHVSEISIAKIPMREKKIMQINIFNSMISPMYKKMYSNITLAILNIFFPRLCEGKHTQCIFFHSAFRNCDTSLPWNNIQQ